MGTTEERISKLLTFPYGSYLMVRLEYVLICGDELEAKILRLIEMRMEEERKRLYREQINAAPKGSVQTDDVIEISTDVWAAISHRLFMYDLYGMVKSENTLKRAIKSLKAKKLIFIRNEPTGRYDAPEYRLNVTLLQTELNKLLKEGKRGYQKLIPSKTDTINSRYPQDLTPSEGQDLTPSSPSRVSEVDTNSRSINSNNNMVEENTLPAVAPSPTASSHDEDAHALLSSEQERIPQDDAHARPVVPTLPPTAHGTYPSQLPAGNAPGHEASEPGMDTPSLIASTTPTPQPAKEKAARKPRAPKPPVDESLQTRIERVYAFFDALGQEVTEDTDYHYRHSKKASEAIVEWLKSSPTEAILREVYLKLWNTPADQRTGFCWRDNMSIVAVLGQYDRMALAIKASRKNGKANLHIVSLSPRESGLKSYSREELLRLPV